MRTLSELVIDAEEATTFRGHLINWQKPYHGERNSLMTGECIRCQAWVQVDTNPLPNGIDIGGPAVAVHCKRSKKSV
jgi:hypothetical protein